MDFYGAFSNINELQAIAIATSDVNSALPISRFGDMRGANIPRPAISHEENSDVVMIDTDSDTSVDYDGEVQTTRRLRPVDLKDLAKLIAALITRIEKEAFALTISARDIAA